jgi:hypothetical protein
MSDTEQNQDNTQTAESDSVLCVVSSEEIPATRKPIAGWRQFECCECEHNWREETRDHKSPSGSNCPKCGEWEFPYASNSDATMKTDPFGNLI